MRRILETTSWNVRRSELSVHGHTRYSRYQSSSSMIDGTRRATSFAQPQRKTTEEWTPRRRADYPASASLPTSRPFKRSPVVVVGVYDQGEQAAGRQPPGHTKGKASKVSGDHGHQCRRPETSLHPSTTRNGHTPPPPREFEEGRSTSTKTPHRTSWNGPRDSTRTTPHLPKKDGRPVQQVGSKPSTKLTPSRPPPRSKRVQVRKDLYIPSMISVSNFSRLLGIRQEVLQRAMKRCGMGDLSSYDHMLLTDDSSLLAMEFGFNPIVDDEAGFDIFPSLPHPEPQTLPERPPIVTIMGHVDHGKTTLLDTLRSASVAKGEAGGITQHIGAFSVPVKVSGDSNQSKSFITFLDTPGHAAFSAMRARGARVTDIVVLVVAADDGVMPQTQEVINLIKQDPKLGVVVAITKCDKEGVDTELVQRQLLGEGLELEGFGGEIPCVEVSGLTGRGLNDLVETISATAEIMEIRAEADGRAHGFVIESKVQKGLGPVATVLIHRGVLKPHSHVISNLSWARVRQMTDATGKIVKAALPGMAVNVSGWKELPNSGDEVLEGEEADIKKALTNRHKRIEQKTMVQDAEAINEHRHAERERKHQAEREAEHLAKTGRHLNTDRETVPTIKELRLIIKGDVSGSVEAVTGALEGIGNHQAKVKIVSTGVGEVSESDISLARAIEGAVVAFNVKIPKSMEIEAATYKVPLISSPIIYRLMEDVRTRVTELLPVVRETKVTGEATVLQLFDINVRSKITKKIAGCRGRNGTLVKSQHIRLMRQGVCVHEGPVETLRHHKSEIQEVSREMDFGLSLQNFEDIRTGDLLQSIKYIELPRKL